MIGEYVFCVCVWGGGLYMDSWPIMAAIYVKKYIYETLHISSTRSFPLVTPHSKNIYCPLIARP